VAVRDWSDGDTLTGAALNEITTSGYMRFASAAERDNTLVGGLAPVAGMRAFMLDTNLVWIYAVVSGTGYWTPQPGTLLFNHYQATAGVVQSTAASFTALPGGRNLGNWFDPVAGRFTVAVPGYYEFFGSVGQSGTGGGGGMQIGVRINGVGGTSGPTSHMFYSPAAAIGSLGTAGVIRNHTRYMVPGDYATLNGAGNYSGSIASGGYNTHFGAIYLGF
jgi:hypothetical protein